MALETPAKQSGVVLSTALQTALDLLAVSPTECDRLLHSDHEHQATLSVTMDDGRLVELPAWRVQHNNVRGPYKGGIRFHSDVSLEEVRTLAQLMAIKTAVAGIPMGGAKGGVQVHGRALSPTEREQVARAYVRAFSEHLGPDLDIPAPDLNTDSQIMAWMLDEYECITGVSSPGVITGKPVELFGSAGRELATARGGKYVLDALLDHLNIKKRPLTVAIQGAGNVGGGVGRLMAEDDRYQVVALSDTHSAVYRLAGLDVNDALGHKARTGSVENAEYTQNLTNAELLALPVDILVLAALENQITEENAGEVKAKIILELANHPISPAGDAVLTQRDALVVPDILANAGGVVASYFEWVQNRQNFYWTETEVNERLGEIMRAAFNEVTKTATTHNVDLRVGAYLVGLSRLLTAIRYRGGILDKP